MYLTKQGGKTDYNYSEIVLDNASELSSISTTQMSPGSIAYVTSNGAVYMLNSLKQWIEQTGDSGTEINNQDKTVTENGIYVADAGYTGLGTVTVNVQPKTETKSVTITENGTTTVSKSDEKDGMTSVEVTVNVPQPSGNINITSTSQIDVSSYATAQVVDADLVAGNIKKDVNILGVTGTYEGSGGSGIDLTSGVKFAYSLFPTIPSIIQNANWEDVIGASWMFSQCGNLRAIDLDLPLVEEAESFADNCGNLVSVNLTNTSSLTSLGYAFQFCRKLTTINQINTQNMLWMDGIFEYCDALSNDSLNNILAMCTNVHEDYSGTKTLEALGLNATQIATCHTLSNYQDFLDAGWSDN